MAKPPINYNAEDAVYSDDHGAWYEEVPRSVSRFAVLGLVLLLLTFGGFGTWAFRAPLAAAVISQGSFVATGRNKIVQHLEGGIIKEIAVREGDVVQAGDLILRLDETAASANERELFLRRARLEATEARLIAENERRSLLEFPLPLLEARGLDNEVATILDGQLLAFRVGRSALDNDLRLLERNIEALTIRGVGYERQLGSHELQVELLQEELEAKEELLSKGLSRRSEVAALKRTLIEAEGQIGRIEAEIGEVSQIKQKYEGQIEKTLGEYRQTALRDLQKIQAELDSIREKERTAQNVRERIDVVAPVTGTIVRLHYHTAGGVIETGRAIAEILPADEPLIIEVQIPRNDIDSVNAGQEATVRLIALNQRTTPVLRGEVFYVSADSITDNSTGTLQEVYVARVSLPTEQIRRVPGFTPTPGMPTEIMIQTESRTFAQYLAKPIKDSMIRAFREQ